MAADGDKLPATSSSTGSFNYWSSLISSFSGDTKDQGPQNNASLFSVNNTRVEELRSIMRNFDQVPAKNDTKKRSHSEGSKCEPEKSARLDGEQEDPDPVENNSILNQQQLSNYPYPVSAPVSPNAYGPAYSVPRFPTPFVGSGLPPYINPHASYPPPAYNHPMPHYRPPPPHPLPPPPSHLIPTSPPPTLLLNQPPIQPNAYVFLQQPSPFQNITTTAGSLPVPPVQNSQQLSFEPLQARPVITTGGLPSSQPIHLNQRLNVNASIVSSSSDTGCLPTSAPPSQASIPKFTPEMSFVPPWMEPPPDRLVTNRNGSVSTRWLGKFTVDLSKCCCEWKDNLLVDSCTGYLQGMPDRERGFICSWLYVLRSRVRVYMAARGRPFAALKRCAKDIGLHLFIDQHHISGEPPERCFEAIVMIAGRRRHSDDPNVEPIYQETKPFVIVLASQHAPKAEDARIEACQMAVTALLKPLYDGVLIKENRWLMVSSDSDPSSCFYKEAVPDQFIVFDVVRPTRFHDARHLLEFATQRYGCSLHFKLNLGRRPPVAELRILGKLLLLCYFPHVKIAEEWMSQVALLHLQKICYTAVRLRKGPKHYPNPTKAMRETITEFERGLKQEPLEVGFFRLLLPGQTKEMLGLGKLKLNYVNIKRQLRHQGVLPDKPIEAQPQREQRERACITGESLSVDEWSNAVENMATAATKADENLESDGELSDGGARCDQYDYEEQIHSDDEACIVPSIYTSLEDGGVSGAMMAAAKTDRALVTDLSSVLSSAINPLHVPSDGTGSNPDSADGSPTENTTEQDLN